MFAVPLAVVVHYSAPLGSLWDWLAIIVWLTAVVGESIADAQLAQWRMNPANGGKTCRVGLWDLAASQLFLQWLHWWTYAAGDRRLRLVACLTLWPGAHVRYPPTI